MTGQNAPRYRSSLGEAEASPFQRERARRLAAAREQSFVKRYRRIIEIRKREQG